MVNILPVAKKLSITNPTSFKGGGLFYSFPDLPFLFTKVLFGKNFEKARRNFCVQLNFLGIHS
jgi:hypothetical protein